MPEPTTAPVTAEDTRERLQAVLEDYTCGCDGHRFECCSEHMAQALVAELASLCDPGDLPARMSAEMQRHYILTNRTTPDGNGICACGHWSGGDPGVCEGWDDHIAEVAMSVRCGHASRQAAEVERLQTALAATRSDVDVMQREVYRHVLANTEQQAEVERLRAELAETKRVSDNLRKGFESWKRAYQGVADQLYASCICDPNPETTEGMLEDCPVHGTEEHRPLALRAERDLLRETLAESDLGAQIQAQWEAIAAADVDRDRLAGELAELKVGVAEAIRRVRSWMDPDDPGPLFAPGFAGEVDRTLRAYIGEHVIAALERRPADPEEIQRLAQTTTEETNDEH
jgi:hypothetical protein